MGSQRVGHNWTGTSCHTLLPRGDDLSLSDHWILQKLYLLTTFSQFSVKLTWTFSQSSARVWTKSRHPFLSLFSILLSNNVWSWGNYRTLSYSLHHRNSNSSSLFGGTCSYHRRRQWLPTPVLLPGKSHGWRSLVGCSPRGHEESDTTERLHFHFSFSCTGEGNGNPLQCSRLENPRDGGAWWAAIYGVAQSDTTEAT